MHITLIVAIVTGLTEVIKRIGLPSKFAPLTAIAIGLIISFLNRGALPTDIVIMTGIVAGLTSAGLYSGTKAVINK